ncbi:MAG TPA: trypsin-like peptidase domain-containing protein [Solirubrobacteraceae bacterium]
MPRIPDELLDCVIYLYPTVEAAEQGARAGGSGFLVSVSMDGIDTPAIYAVTNSHVVREGKSPVIRLNTQDGTKKVIDIVSDQWFHHPDGDDVTICPLGLKTDDLYRFHALPCGEWLLSEEAIADANIGPGDDVFIIGRFVNHEGNQRNLPVVRFGSIAMMPYEPIKHQRGIDVESYLIEARSLSGFSGSPIFLYIPPFSLRDTWWTPDKSGVPTTESISFGLLGIDSGHFTDYKRVLDKDKKPRIGNEESYVEQNSGIMTVVPSWKLGELLENPEVVRMRRQWRDEEVERQRREPAATLDVALTDDEFANFKKLASQIVQVPKSEIDEKRKK